jgi:3-hydroxymyristoyl/3-hydroxydecanoyl-(acyl carrier protein) dehydratase
MTAAVDPVLRVAQTHPSLRGHFPGAPVVPGVVLLSLIFAELSRRWPQLRVRGITKLKFLRLFLPEQVFTVEFGEPDANAVRFKCWHNGVLLVVGRLATVGGE